MSSIDRHATRVTRRLHHDRELMRRFRQAPRRVLADQGLAPLQVQAVLSGSAHDLAAAGIDPARVQRPPLGRRIRMRVLTVVSAVLALLGGPLLAAPASAARARWARFGARFVRADARRIGRHDARFARRFARTTVRRARFFLPGRGGGCELKCIEVEILP